MSAEEPNHYQNLVGNGLSQLEADVLAEYKHLADTIKETSKLMKQVLELSKGPAGSMRAVERNFGPLQSHFKAAMYAVLRSREDASMEADETIME